MLFLCAAHTVHDSEKNLSSNDVNASKQSEGMFTLRTGLIVVYVCGM